MFPDENKHRLTIQYRMHPTIGTLISHVLLCPFGFLEMHQQYRLPQLDFETIAV